MEKAIFSKENWRSLNDVLLFKIFSLAVKLYSTQFLIFDLSNSKADEARILTSP
jgi:hypothetical protein